MGNKWRFDILKDVTYKLQTMGGATDQPGLAKFNWFIKLNKPEVFDADDATFGSISNGSLVMYLIGQNATGVTAAEIISDVRLRFSA